MNRTGSRLVLVAMNRKPVWSGPTAKSLAGAILAGTQSATAVPPPGATSPPPGTVAATTTVSFLREARRLRTEAENADAAFLDYLVWGETRQFWCDTGQTYIEFLDGSNLCRPARYERYKRGRLEANAQAQVHGQVGVEAIVAAGGFRDPVEQRAVLSEARIFERTNGTSISEQSARGIARDVRNRSVAIRSQRRSYADLFEDNQRLRTDNQALRLKVAALKAENASLRTQLRKSKPKTKPRVKN